jgi:hypothetical protein
MAKRGCSSIGVDYQGRRYSKGVDCDILAHGFNRIVRILMPPRYSFYSESPTTKNSRIKCAWPGAILGRVID